MRWRRYWGWIFTLIVVESFEFFFGHRPPWSAFGVACYVVLVVFWTEFGPWQGYRTGPLGLFYACRNWRSPAVIAAALTGTVMFMCASVVIDLFDPAGTTAGGVAKQFLYAIMFAPLLGLLFLRPVRSSGRRLSETDLNRTRN